jgi:hypothetical protein
VSTSTLHLDQFVSAAQRFSGIALTAYTKGEFELVLMNAAIAMENLSKALLFATNPAFLVELHTKQFDALLFLTGHGHKATKLRTPRTIGAKEALARVRQLIEIKTPKEPLDRLIEIRDGALHTGSFGPTSTRELLTYALRYVNEIYDGLENLQAWCDDRWGEHTDLVDTLVKQSWTDVQHEVNRKVTAARARLRELMDQIPGDLERHAVAEARQDTVSHLAGRPLGRNEDGLQISGELLHCPACNYPGALCLGVVLHEYDLPEKLGPMDRIEEVASLVDVYIESRVLTCRVCGIDLAGADELKAAGVPLRMEVVENIRRYFSYPEESVTALGLPLEPFS